jgi:hypothetical protein
MSTVPEDEKQLDTVLEILESNQNDGSVRIGAHSVLTGSVI